MIRGALKQCKEHIHKSHDFMNNLFIIIYGVKMDF